MHYPQYSNPPQHTYLDQHNSPINLHPHPHSIPQPAHAQVHGHAHSPSAQSMFVPPSELVNLGLAARDSRLEDRWTSFMHESGFLEGMNGASPHLPPPPY